MVLLAALSEEKNMAQSGYTPILIYASGTTGNAPSAANLTSSSSGAELALNYFDGKLFYKDSSGNVQVLAVKMPSGVLPIANGGTNATATPTAGAVAYGTGTAYAFTAAGTSNQVLVSNGASAPSWSSLSSIGVTTFSAGTTGFTPSSATSGAITLAGTLATTNGGTGLTSFTANGVVYASSTSALTTGSALQFDGSNLGLGVTPSASSLPTFEAQVGLFVGRAEVDITSNAYYNGGWKYVSSGLAPTQYQAKSGAHKWFTAPSGTAGNAISFTQAMTLDASGNLLVGDTSGTGNGERIYSVTSIFVPFAGRHSSTSAGKFWFFGPNSGNNYVVQNQSSVGVYITDGGTSWTSTSDERIKTNLIPIENAVQKVSTLRAVTGRFKTDDIGVSRAFLIAQDVKAVLPEAVSMDNDEIGTLGVSYTETIPLLVAAIKELAARVATLEGTQP